jgi:anti-sigma regulatory factor (Ser/Thr protein kinase)
VSAATVHGTGTMAAQEQPLLLPPSSPGLYLRHRNRGFTAYITAGRDTLSTVRRLTRTVLLAYGADTDLAETAQLVLSELVGNAERACGTNVPLVIEVFTTAFGVAVSVHDPVPELLPQRGGAGLDSDVAESGRGLALLDLLAPGWTIECSPLGKQIQCHLVK